MSTVDLEGGLSHLDIAALVRFTHKTISRILNPSHVTAACCAEASTLGLSDDEMAEILFPEAAAGAPPTPTKSPVIPDFTHSEPAASPTPALSNGATDAKKPRSARKKIYNLYLIFGVKARKLAGLETLRQLNQSSNKGDSKNRSTSFSLTAELWNHMSPENKAAFSAAYSPLVDFLNVEYAEVGVKDECLLDRVKEYEAQMTVPFPLDELMSDLLASVSTEPEPLTAPALRPAPAALLPAVPPAAANVAPPPPRQVVVTPQRVVVAPQQVVAPPQRVVVAPQQVPVAPAAPAAPPATAPKASKKRKSVANAAPTPVAATPAGGAGPSQPVVPDMGSAMPVAAPAAPPASAPPAARPSATPGLAEAEVSAKKRKKHKKKEAQPAASH